MTQNGMEVPANPGRLRAEEALPLFMNPANNVVEQMITVLDTEITEIEPLDNRQELVIQVQTEGGAVWVKWGGGAVSVGDGMRIPAGNPISMRVAKSCPVAIIAEGGPATLYVGQFGGKFA